MEIYFRCIVRARKGSPFPAVVGLHLISTNVYIFESPLKGHPCLQKIADKREKMVFMENTVMCSIPSFKEYEFQRYFRCLIALRDGHWPSNY